MRRTSEGIRYSPTDLCRFMESRFASWQDRLALDRPELKPDEVPDDLALIFDKGVQHERDYLEKLKQSHEVVEAPGDTLAAMQAGAEVIYQARLDHDGFLGYADFLVRLPDGTYEPWDTKLARRAKPYYAIQLCAYAEMLEALQGRRPERLHVVLGTNDIVPLRTNDYFFYYRALKRDFLAFMEGFDPHAPPLPEPGSDHTPWQSHADRWLEEKDHLQRVAGINRSQIRKLEEAGIGTMACLAATTRDQVPRLDDRLLGRLKRQARLQVESAGRERPLFEIVDHQRELEEGRGLAMLPPEDPADVFFDMEGYPLMEGGLEYLFGATYLDDDRRPAFLDWWAHDRAQEKQAFEDFIDWVQNRWQKNRGMHIYHYAAYEKTALTGLAQRHATREEEVDELLRGRVLVDLYRVIRQGVVVGEPRYSIKNIERLYRGKREGEVATATGSIAAYGNWIKSGEPGDWRESKLLEEIRDYNRDDCDSTLQLARWLRERQKEAGIKWRGPPPEREAAGEEEEQAPVVEAHGPHAELLELLLDFHRREDNPVWWAMFDRAEQTEAALFEDFDCLAGLERTDEPRIKVKRSWGYPYRFDPVQETKVSAGHGYLLAHDLAAHVQVESLDREQGRALLKAGPKLLDRIGEMPGRLSLIPGGPINSRTLSDAVRAVVCDGVSPALDDYLSRRAPRIAGLAPGDPLTTDLADLALRMEQTCLCVQGPPGSGKTYNGAKTILALLRAGKRVGVTSNSHKAIENLLAQCMEEDGAVSCLKVNGSPEFFDAWPNARHIPSNQAAGALARTPLVGGTAWAFARDDMLGALDHLFVDEAGQVSLGNLVAMSRSTKNLVLLGDQMQLGQPIQGSHPGESGKSVLEYLLEGRPTIPSELGVFLGETWRLHPRICGFISDAVYEGRLLSAPVCGTRTITVPDGANAILTEAGMVFIPVNHQGNAQASDEEVAAIAKLVDELLGRERQPGKQRLSLDDILFVAPYNLQVRALKERLGDQAKVGSVDRFQGQQAPVVILSMCASDGDASPRGIEFLLDRNRLNVALSRAQSLAVVVANPALARTRCSTLEQMRLVNLFARVVEEGRGATSGSF